MKKENNLITIIKGYIVGLGVVFPVSSSVLAIAMGIYEKILYVINNLVKCFKKEWKFILCLGIGIVLAAITSSLFLDYTLDKFPIATMLFFIGLVVGGVPLLFKKTKKEYSVSNILWLIIGAALLIGISFITGGEDKVISTSLLGLLAIFGVGIVGGISMIVPGISGAVMLVILGYYEPLLEIITNTVHMQNIGPNILVIMAFGFGMLVGIVLTSKIMAYFLEKHEVKSYFTIIGFVIASIINIVIGLFGNPFNIIEFIIGLGLFAAGFLISFKYLKEE
jgi:putative membrane protein